MIDIESLEKSDEIVFGPFVGEFGWEVLKWSGFVRWFKEKHPDKKIIVSTRKTREDLYTNSTDYLELFELQGDYIDYFPVHYDHPNLPEKMFKSINDVLKDKYPNAFFFEPRGYMSIGDLFSFENMNFNYTPKKSNFAVIDSLSKEFPDRIPIVISSRIRKEEPRRNWGETNWKTLFKLLNNSRKFLVFVSGINQLYYRCNDSHTSFYNLEDYYKQELQTSVAGLTIAAIKSSKLTVGVKTATITLSNLIGTQTLFSGENVIEDSRDNNIYNTKTTSIQDRGYISDPNVIFENIISIATK